MSEKTPAHWLKIIEETPDNVTLDELRGLPAEMTHWLLLHPNDSSATRLLELLANDRRWEVRLALARSLRKMPEPLFEKLAQTMGEDSNAYVKDAAKQALHARTSEKRRVAAHHPGRTQTLSEIERLYDSNAAKMAERAANARSVEFLRSVVHDLKTVAGRIRTGTSGLSHYVPAKPEPTRYMSLINRAASDVESLVSCINALSRPGKLEFADEDIGDLVENAVESAKADLRGQGDDISPVKVSIHCPEPVHARVSRSNILLAMTNLIKNAIESHGSYRSYLPGSVSISITREREDVLIVIADDGCGLRPSDVAALNEFMPGHSSKPTGAGYGLPIAKRNIDAHEGTLRLESQRGLGTTVTVELPIERGESHAPRTAR